MEKMLVFVFVFLSVVSALENSTLLSEAPLPQQLSVTAYDLKYASHHLYVDPVHKLVYCAIPKVACTEFARLLFRLKGRNKDKGRWLSDPHFRYDKPLLKDLGAEEATRIMNDPTWTKFVFFRDPIERLVSAWLDKFERGKAGSKATSNYKLRFYGKSNLSFAEFVDIVSLQPAPTKRSDFRGLGPYSNAHWRPQRYACHLDKFLGAYDFIGSFKKLREHTEILLREKGLWDDYGSWGWNEATWKTRRAVQRGTLTKENPGPTSAIFQKNLAWNRLPQAPKERSSTLLTPDITNKLRKAYWMDYDMFDALNWNHHDDTPKSGRSWFHKNTTNAGWLLCLADRAFCDDSQRTFLLQREQNRREQIQARNKLEQRQNNT